MLVINKKWMGLYLAPALIFASVISFAINEWRLLVSAETKDIDDATSIQLAGIQRDVANRITSSLVSLEQMADRMGKYPMLTKQNWISDVKNQIKNHSNLYGFVWLNSAGEMIYQYSTEADFEFEGFDKTQPMRMPRPFHKHDDLVHQAIFPIMNGYEKRGYLIVQGYLTNILKSLTKPYTDEGYKARLVMGGTKACCDDSSENYNEDIVNWGKSSLLEIGANKIAITLWPKRETISLQQRHQTKIPLVAGSLVSTLLALSFHFIFLSRWRSRKLKQLYEELSSLSLATEQSQAAVLIVDPDGVVVYANSMFSQKFGAHTAEIKGKHFSQIDDHKLSPRFYKQLENQLSNVSQWSGEIVVNDTDVAHWENVTMSPVFNDEGVLIYFLAMGYDITERKELEIRLDSVSYHDKVTGLYNRSYLQENSGVLLIQSHLIEKKLAVIFIDLDHFKKVNDSLGHGIGDHVLIEVAERLQNFVKKPKDILVRLGGDEFCLVITELVAEEDIALVAREILSSIQERMFISGQELIMTASLGISVYPDDGLVFSDLMKNADTALYDTKSSGRAGYSFFRPEMNEAVAENLTLELELRSALERGEFELYYQPQVDSVNHKIISVEALLRWNHPELGLISPGKFIPILEESGLIVEVGEWIIAEACRRLVELTEIFPYPVSMGINISPKQLKQHEFLYRVESLLKGNGYKQGIHTIEFEITESTVMEQMAESIIVLNELSSRLGILIAIDDFGTGYSSLNSLNKLPLDTLKIDRSFITDVNKNPDAQKIVTAIISMGHSLNLRIIAEGVETMDELRFISSFGNIDIQGFLFSRPLPSKELEQLIKHSNCIKVA